MIAKINGNDGSSDNKQKFWWNREKLLTQWKKKIAFKTVYFHFFFFLLLFTFFFSHFLSLIRLLLFSFTINKWKMNHLLLAMLNNKFHRVWLANIQKSNKYTFTTRITGDVQSQKLKKNKNKKTNKCFTEIIIYLYIQRIDIMVRVFANGPRNRGLIPVYHSQIRLCVKCTDARGVMVIVVGNGHDDTSSNPGRDWLHFT